MDRWALALAMPPHEGAHLLSLLQPPFGDAHSDRRGVSREVTPPRSSLSSRSRSVTTESPGWGLTRVAGGGGQRTAPTRWLVLPPGSLLTPYPRSRQRPPKRRHLSSRLRVSL